MATLSSGHARSAASCCNARQASLLGSTWPFSHRLTVEKVTLSDCGKDLSTMKPEESLWQAGTGAAGITSGTLYLRFGRRAG